MPAVANWASPYQFDLTNPYNGTMSFNVQTASGLYLLDQSKCKFRVGVRSTKSNVPQSNGSILHTRFLSGAEMDLSIQLWEENDKIACDTVLQNMLDDLSGALLSLLNAGDNEGRLAWEVAGGNERMLDDIRLLVYPDAEVLDSGLTVVTCTIDSKYAYAEDLTQQLTTITSGGSQVLTNTGTSETFPVYKVKGTFSSFTLTNTTTGESLVYSGTTITSPDYVEFDSFNNTAFLNGNSTDELPSLDITSSLFPVLGTGANTVTITGADVDVLWNPSWA